MISKAQPKAGMSPLVIKHDRSTVKKRGSQAAKFFSTYHLDCQPRMESEVYESIDPKTLNFPENAIICRFKDGRYR
jgi:hypothetical protein